MSKKKTPEFIGKYEKIKDHWPAFVAHKTSEKSKKMSETNKKNAAKKKLHHRTGSGGYLKARPKWSKAENDLLEKGTEPETMNWLDRCRTWFFGAGGTLDPVSGKETSGLYSCRPGCSGFPRAIVSSSFSLFGRNVPRCAASI